MNVWRYLKKNCSWSTKRSTEEVKGKPDTCGSVRQVLFERLLPQPAANEGTDCEEIKKLPASPVDFQKQALLVWFLGRCPRMPFTGFRGLPRK